MLKNWIKKGIYKKTISYLILRGLQMKLLTVDPSVGFPSVVPKTFSRQNFITKSYLLSSTICKNFRPIEWSSLSKIWSKKSTNSVRSFSEYRGQLVFSILDIISITCGLILRRPRNKVEHLRPNWITILRDSHAIFLASNLKTRLTNGDLSFSSSFRYLKPSSS